MTRIRTHRADSVADDQHRHDPGEIRARGVLDDDDLTAVQMLGGLSGTGKLILVIVLLAAVAATIAQSAAFLQAEDLIDDRRTAWVVATAAFAVVGALALVALRLLAARRRAHRVSGAEIECVVRPDGLEIRDPWARARLPWSDFAGWDETESSFCFYQRADVCRVLPIRFLQPGDADRLRMWLRQILGEPGAVAAGTPAAGTPAAGEIPAATSSASRHTEAGREPATGPAIACAGVPEWSEWALSRPLLERIESRVVTGALITIIVVVAVLGTIMALDLATDPELLQEARSVLPMAFVFGILLFFMVRRGRAARRAWDENPIRLSYRLTPRGLHLEHGTETVDLAWTDLESWHENRHAFVFVLGGGRWYFLPRRFLDSGQRQPLRTWLDDRASGG